MAIVLIVALVAVVGLVAVYLLGRSSPSEGAFRAYDPSALGSSDLESYLREHEPRAAFFFVGELSSGKPFAIVIGLSKEWLNVVTLNRARLPAYETYGFNMQEERWSYGSAPLGAPEIRQFLKEARTEVLSKIAGLGPERRASALRRIKYEAQEAVEDWAAQRAFKAERRELKRVQKARRPALQSNFAGVPFEFNRNKARHLAAQEDAERHYYEIDLHTQTCACEEFASNNAEHPTGDVRRLCEHLSHIIERRSLLRRHSDPLRRFLLEESLHDVVGVHTGELIDGKRFGVVVRRSLTTVLVATPHVKDDGFSRTIWRFENGAWTSRSCAKKYKEALKEKLTELLPE